MYKKIYKFDISHFFMYSHFDRILRKGEKEKKRKGEREREFFIENQ